MQLKTSRFRSCDCGITATSDFITAPIFREFGITEIIATNAEVLDGNIRVR
jgi:phosphoserine phosphatase